MNKIYLIITLFFIPFIMTKNSKKPLSMINPAGHAKNMGRKLVENYERTQTFKCAKVLKKKLQEKYKIKCVLTKNQREEAIDMQCASFANRSNADFYLSLHIFKSRLVKPQIFLYHRLCNSITDLAPRKFSPYYIFPVHKSHQFNILKTKIFGEKIKKVLCKNYSKQLDFHGLFGIPLRPLCGLISPALLLEIGICKETQLDELIEYIVESLYFLENSSETLRTNYDTFNYT